VPNYWNPHPEESTSKVFRSRATQSCPTPRLPIIMTLRQSGESVHPVGKLLMQDRIPIPEMVALRMYRHLRTLT